MRGCAVQVGRRSGGIHTTVEKKSRFLYAAEISAIAPEVMLTADHGSEITVRFQIAQTIGFACFFATRVRLVTLGLIETSTRASANHLPRGPGLMM